MIDSGFLVGGGGVQEAESIMKGGGGGIHFGTHVRKNILCMGCVIRLTELWLDATPCSYIPAEAKLPQSVGINGNHLVR